MARRGSHRNKSWLTTFLKAFNYIQKKILAKVWMLISQHCHKKKEAKWIFIRWHDEEMTCANARLSAATQFGKLCHTAWVWKLIFQHSKQNHHLCECSSFSIHAIRSKILHTHFSPLQMTRSKFYRFAFFVVKLHSFSCVSLHSSNNHQNRDFKMTTNFRECRGRGMSTRSNS